ncbi:MAG TPA: galactokinase family protein [Rectinemataceae bacterium]|nr:galactokinase family protein [Rectinemataceae bacterium]
MNHTQDFAATSSGKAIAASEDAASLLGGRGALDCAMTASDNAMAVLPLPTSVPRLASIDALYAPETLEVQRRRYRKLRDGFFAHFSDRRGEPDGQAEPDERGKPGWQAGPEPLFFSAPGRTELCGNHTDHNNGKVLAAAISLDTIGAAAPRMDSLVRVVSEGFDSFEVDLADLTVRRGEKGSSAAIVRGMAAGIAARSDAAARHDTAARRGAAQPYGTARSYDESQPYDSSSRQRDGSRVSLRGFDAFIQSDVLPGSGLSSSAAFEVLVGSMICVFSGIEVSPSEIAKIGQYAENEYFGKPCGLMDQMACALGNTAAIDFGDPSNAKVELLRFDPSEYGLSLAIVATGGSHADLTDDYAAIPGEMRAVAAVLGRSTLAGTSLASLLAQAGEIRKSCGDRAFLRAWHFVKETGRPAILQKAIQAKDIAAYLATVKASGDSSAKYLQNLYAAKSPCEQGILVALAVSEDFLAAEGACRVHGGGFAGTIQTYVPTIKLSAYKALMESMFGPSSVFPLRIRPFGVVCIESKKGAFDER